MRYRRASSPGVFGCRSCRRLSRPPRDRQLSVPNLSRFLTPRNVGAPSERNQAEGRVENVPETKGKRASCLNESKAHVGEGDKRTTRSRGLRLRSVGMLPYEPGKLYTPGDNPALFGRRCTATKMWRLYFNDWDVRLSSASCLVHTRILLIPLRQSRTCTKHEKKQAREISERPLSGKSRLRTKL